MILIFKLIETLINILPPKPISFFNSDITPATESRVIDVLKNNARTTFSENLDIEFLKWFNLDEVISNNSTGTGELVKDENNVLYQGVLRGVAPLAGSMTQIHKKIVQELFIKQKIQLLLATDALGVGANVKCKHIYIPTVYKFNGERLERNDESSLTQLVHRAGRGDFDLAYVYSSIEDYDYISNLIFNDPREAVPEINVYALKNLESLESLLPKRTFIKTLMRLL
jgi:replicative superfamily II helicase